MAFREIGVKVTITEEGFAIPSPEVGLPPIFIGPLFQVVTKGTFGAYDYDSGITGSYQGLETDATVDTESVKVYIVHELTGTEYDVTDGDDGGQVPVITATTLTIPSGMYEELTDGNTGDRLDESHLNDPSGDFDAVRYGDLLVMEDNNDEEVTIRGIDDDGYIEVLTREARNILYYDTLTADFTIGAKVTGAAGASATIIDVYKSGVAGYLLLGAVTGGPFVDGENLVDNGVTPAAAKADGVQALIGTAMKLHFNAHAVSPAVGDTLDGVTSGAQGTVLYEEDDGTIGFVLLTMVIAGFQQGEDLNVGAVLQAVAATTEVEIEGTVGGLEAESVIYYDALTASFNAGAKLTGGVTSAYAYIIEVYESGTTGYLILGGITGGPFQDNEALTDDGTVPGAAVANGINAMTAWDHILYFDTLAGGSFAPGDILTNGVPAAKAVVLYNYDNGSGGFVLINKPSANYAIGDTLTVGGVTAVVTAVNALINIDVDRVYEVRRPFNGMSYHSFRACRSDVEDEAVYISDHADNIEYCNSEEQIDILNPLGNAGGLSLDIGSPCYLIAVDDLAGALDPKDADLVKWSKALEVAKELATPYGYVPLVQSDGVRSLLELFINWKRDPDNYMPEVVGMFCPERTTDEEAIAQRQAVEGMVNATELKDSGISSFLARGCEDGGTLELIDVDGVVTGGAVNQVYQFTIDTVTADTILLTGAGASADEQLIKFYRIVNEYYDNDSEADYYKTYGEAIQNQSIRLMYPASIILMGETEETPGYYLGVIRAAQFNVNKPHHIYHREATPLVDSVVSDFNRTQLNTVASGGWQIFYQEDTNSPVYCRRAMTTDMSLASREEEVVQTEIDYSARYIRAVFLPSQGRHHRDEMLEDGNAMLAGGCIEHLVEDEHILSALEVVKIEGDASEPRKSNVEFAATPRYPNLWTDIVIRVL